MKMKIMTFSTHMLRIRMKGGREQRNTRVNDGVKNITDFPKWKLYFNYLCAMCYTALALSFDTRMREKLVATANERMDERGEMSANIIPNTASHYKAISENGKSFICENRWRILLTWIEVRAKCKVYCEDSSMSWKVSILRAKNDKNEKNEIIIYDTWKITNEIQNISLERERDKVCVCNTWKLLVGKFVYCVEIGVKCVQHETWRAKSEQSQTFSVFSFSFVFVSSFRSCVFLGNHCYKLFILS